MKTVDQDYNISENFMLRNKAVYKLKTPYKGPYEITHMQTSVTATLQIGAITNRLCARQINPY